MYKHWDGLLVPPAVMCLTGHVTCAWLQYDDYWHGFAGKCNHCIEIDRWLLGLGSIWFLAWPIAGLLLLGLLLAAIPFRLARFVSVLSALFFSLWSVLWISSMLGTVVGIFVCLLSAILILLHGGWFDQVPLTKRDRGIWFALSSLFFIAGSLAPLAPQHRSELSWFAVQNELGSPCHVTLHSADGWLYGLPLMSSKLLKIVGSHEIGRLSSVTVRSKGRTTRFDREIYVQPGETVVLIVREGKVDTKTVSTRTALADTGY